MYFHLFSFVWTIEYITGGKAGRTAEYTNWHGGEWMTSKDDVSTDDRWSLPVPSHHVNPILYRILLLAYPFPWSRTRTRTRTRTRRFTVWYFRPPGLWLGHSSPRKRQSYTANYLWSYSFSLGTFLLSPLPTPPPHQKRKRMIVYL